MISKLSWKRRRKGSTVWTKAARLLEIKEGEPKAVSVDGKDIALFKTEGAVYAMDSVCPHRGGPLGEGHIENGEVTCPWHAWSFNVKTGECQTMLGIMQPTFPVKIEGDDILVRLG